MLEPVTAFIKLLIWTGQVEDESPISAIMVAPKGGGKTTVLESCAGSQSLFIGDLTARTMKEILARGNDEVTHLLLGDMLAMFGHKKSTVDLTKQIAAKLTGEGLSTDPWTGLPMDTRKMGLITAIPPEEFAEYQREILKGGFGSRFLFFTYTYGDAAKAKVHTHIRKNGYANKKTPEPFNIPFPVKRKVSISNSLGKGIQEFAFELAKDPLGFRAHRHIRALVKASARSENRTTASRKDLDRIIKFRNFFTEDGKQL